MADYKALVDTLLADYMSQYQEKAAAAKKAKAHDLAVIDAFNKNPRAYKDDEKMQIALAARNYGVSIAEGARNDKATAWEKAKALGGGAVDSLLFGLLKNDWYSDDSTKGWADAGRIGGTIGSFLIPGIGWLGGAGKGLKVLSAAGGVGKAAKTLKFADSLNDSRSALHLAASSFKGAKTALKAADAAADGISMAKLAKLSKSATTLKNSYTQISNAINMIPKYKEGLTAAKQALEIANISRNPISIAKAAAQLNAAQDLYDSARMLKETSNLVTLGKSARDATASYESAKAAMDSASKAKQAFSTSQQALESARKIYSAKKVALGSKAITNTWDKGKALSLLKNANKFDLIAALSRLAQAGYMQNKVEPSFADKTPDYTDEQKLKEFFMRYYGNSEAGMPATQ